VVLHIIGGPSHHLVALYFSSAFLVFTGIFSVRFSFHWYFLSGYISASLSLYICTDMYIVPNMYLMPSYLDSYDLFSFICCFTCVFIS
jgi:hypothetical protein